jgi:disulfide bond formation protein DsbB
MSSWVLIFAAWFVSLTATMGSLFFSEVLKYPPCVLCWYQRIAMYPMVLLLLAGLFPLSRSLFRFTLPLLFGGWAVALYHNLLYFKIIPESSAPCQQGISCTSMHLEWLGFITIPSLSFVAFTLIIGLLLKARRNNDF